CLVFNVLCLALRPLCACNASASYVTFCFCLTLSHLAFAAAEACPDFPLYAHISLSARLLINPFAVLLKNSPNTNAMHSQCGRIRISLETDSRSNGIGFSVR